MTVLRVGPLPGGSLDRAIAEIGTATLVRRIDGAFVDVADDDTKRSIRAFALAGVAAEAAPVDLAAPPRLIPALGVDLVPVAKGMLVADVVRVQRLELGHATRELLARPLGGFGRPTTASKQVARALLRGEDAMFAWTRVAWATRETLRMRAVRRSLRPAIFDRAAVERPDLRGRALASAGALTRWLFT